MQGAAFAYSALEEIEQSAELTTSGHFAFEQRASLRCISFRKATPPGIVRVEILQ